MNRATSLLLLAVISLGCVKVSVTRHSPTPSIADGYDAGVRSDIERLRVATASFQHLDSAVAAGWPRSVAQCLVHEHHGAMGYHHVNRSYVDNTVDIEKPEILLYERLADSTYRLNGVEYIIPYARWPRDSTPPVLLGQKLMHEDNLNIWFLHVWAWNKNPNGLFANFHPAVDCRGSDRRVFKPSGG